MLMWLYDRATPVTAAYAAIHGSYGYVSVIKGTIPLVSSKVQNTPEASSSVTFFWSSRNAHVCLTKNVWARQITVIVLAKGVSDESGPDGQT